MFNITKKTFLSINSCYFNSYQRLFSCSKLLTGYSYKIKPVQPVKDGKRQNTQSKSNPFRHKMRTHLNDKLIDSLSRHLGSNDAKLMILKDEFDPLSALNNINHKSEDMQEEQKHVTKVERSKMKTKNF